jgi:hypothetical protein
VVVLARVVLLGGARSVVPGNAGGVTSDRSAAVAVATSASPSRTSLPSTRSGVSSGGGRRSVTSAVVPAPRVAAATRPQVYPPLPESGGPLYRAATTISFTRAQ